MLVCPCYLLWVSMRNPILAVGEQMGVRYADEAQRRRRRATKEKLQLRQYMGSLVKRRQQRYPGQKMTALQCPGLTCAFSVHAKRLLRRATWLQDAPLL
jgi:hypothetical protein